MTFHICNQYRNTMTKMSICPRCPSTWNVSLFQYTWKSKMFWISYYAGTSPGELLLSVCLCLFLHLCVLYIVLQLDQRVNDQPKEKEGKTCGSSCVAEKDRNKPTYCVTDVPPWYLSIFLAIQVGVILPVLWADFSLQVYFKLEYPGCSPCVTHILVGAIKMIT